MSITFTINAAGTNIVNQNEININLSKSLTIENFTDENSPDALISDYTFSWFFIDKPQTSSCSLDTTVTANNQTVILNSIDTWGTYRIFCIAEEISNSSNKSNDNPLRAEENSFINIIVKSTNNLLEKPASFQRNWKSQYDKLVEVVDNTTKRVNHLKVSNSTTFTLPLNDGTSGQILSTDGSGLLSFVNIDLSNIETNLSLDSLTDVVSANPQDGQTLIWNSGHWEPGNISVENNEITGLVSDTNTQTLTIGNGYSLIPGAGLGSNDIGSITDPFANLYVENLDASTSLLINGILYAATDGPANSYLKTNGSGTTSFETISYSEISGTPTIETLIGGSPTEGQFLKWDDANSIWSPGDVSLNLSVTQNAASGNGTLSYNSSNGVLTYTPPDLSNLGGGGSGLTNWTENASGHIVPNANATYDIGEAENKVRHLYLSNNSLYIGDKLSSIKYSTNNNIGFTNSSESLSFSSPSIGLTAYNFSFETTQPEDIIANNYYRIEQSGTVDFRLVGALTNEVDHVFKATSDGLGILSNDGVANVKQSITTLNPQIFVSSNSQNQYSMKSVFKFYDGSETREFVSLGGSGLDTFQDKEILVFSRPDPAGEGDWDHLNINDANIKKIISLSYDNVWNTERAFVAEMDPVTFIEQKYTPVLGASQYLFSFKNTIEKEINIEKVTFSCLNMGSNEITWSIAKATDAEFKQNIVKTLNSATEQTLSRENEDGNYIGIGSSDYDYSENYDGIANGEWFVLVINSITSDINSNGINSRFTLDIYYV